MKIKIISLTILFVLLMTACNEADFLDLKNPNNVVETDFWKSEADVLAGMATVYSPVRGQMSGYYGAFEGFQNMNVRGDDVWALIDDPETWKITVFTNSPNTDRNNFGDLYKCISRANILIEGIEKVPGIDSNLKKELIAEAKFLRGFNYMLLVMNYEDAPLRLTSVNNTGETMAPSVPAANLWEQVEKDFTDAKDLPATRPDSEKGRVTRGAAYAFLGKAYIFQGKHQEGKTELETIMKSPYTYNLVDKYEDNFTTKNEFNQESIFEINYAKFGSGSWGAEGSTDTQGMVIPNFIGTPKTGGWFKLMPSVSLIDEFMDEERPAGSDSKFDKRMYSSVYFEYSDYNDVKVNERWYGSNYNMDSLWTSTAGKRASGGAPVFTTVNGVTGRFLVKKYTNFWLDSKNGDSMYNPEPMDNNFRIMRFAEVLLLHAEAAAKTGQYPQATDDINRIRTRAGLPTKTWSDEAGLMAEIEHQHLLEFFLEGHRFFYLKHWYSYGDLKNLFIKRGKQGAVNFENKHFVYPIPQTELNTNTEIQQHPMWR